MSQVILVVNSMPCQVLQLPQDNHTSWRSSLLSKNRLPSKERGNTSQSLYQGLNAFKLAEVEDKHGIFFNHYPVWAQIWHQNEIFWSRVLGQVSGVWLRIIPCFLRVRHGRYRQLFSTLDERWWWWLSTQKHPQVLCTEYRRDLGEKTLK